MKSSLKICLLYINNALSQIVKGTNSIINLFIFSVILFEQLGSIYNKDAFIQSLLEKREKSKLFFIQIYGFFYLNCSR